MAETDLTAPLDGCPSCTARNNRPIRVRDDGRAGFTAMYRCPSCLYSWTTGWARGGAR